MYIDMHCLFQRHGHCWLILKEELRHPNQMLGKTNLHPIQRAQAEQIREELGQDIVGPQESFSSTVKQ